jgi:hypothetical protein
MVPGIIRPAFANGIYLSTCNRAACRNVARPLIRAADGEQR